MLARRGLRPAFQVGRQKCPGARACTRLRFALLEVICERARRRCSAHRGIGAPARRCKRPIECRMRLLKSSTAGQGECRRRVSVCQPEVDVGLFGVTDKLLRDGHPFQVVGSQHEGRGVHVAKRASDRRVGDQAQKLFGLLCDPEIWCLAESNGDTEDFVCDPNTLTRRVDRNIDCKLAQQLTRTIAFQRSHRHQPAPSRLTLRGRLVVATASARQKNSSPSCSLAAKCATWPATRRARN